MPYVLVNMCDLIKHTMQPLCGWKPYGLNKFKVCLREMQNFDGQHKKISVVSNATVDLARVIK